MDRCTWPIERFAPSSSIALSKVNRLVVVFPLFFSSWEQGMARYERFRASHSFASPYCPKGSRFVLNVPETVDGLSIKTLSWEITCLHIVTRAWPISQVDERNTWKLTGSWGIIARALRKSVNPIWDMSMSSIWIDPEDSSTSRYNATNSYQQIHEGKEDNSTSHYGTLARTSPAMRLFDRPALYLTI